jgi:hypothetical protein
MTATASEVPFRYDVVINGEGYLFDKRTENAAELGHSPTFVTRQNVSGAYGDNEQEFFLTFSQNDWSGGEGQNFISLRDQDTWNKYKRSTNIFITQPGQAVLNSDAATVSLTAPIACSRGGSSKVPLVVTATQASMVTASGTLFGPFNHGAGTPTEWAVTSDEEHYYIAGATAIRRMNTSGVSFAFSATTAAGALEYLNNALYSFDGRTLRTYSTAGVATTLHTFQLAEGTGRTIDNSKIAAFGGELLILLKSVMGPELWTYDGAGVRRLAQMTGVFYAHDMLVHDGVVYISGLIDNVQQDAFTGGVAPVIYTYLNGSLDELWRGNTTSATTVRPSLGLHRGKALWSYGQANEVMQYDPATGAISRLFQYSNPSESVTSFMAFPPQAVVLFHPSNSTHPYFPATTVPTRAATGTLQLSAVDFDTSVPKAMRGIKVEWSGSGSVDIAYAIDDDALSPTFTTLQTTAVSGTEYTFAAATIGKRITVKLTLNRSGTNSPILRRVYVRAAPTLQSFRRGVYLIDCTSRDGEQPLARRDGTPHNLDGLSMLTNLRTAVTSTTPLSITDSLGTFTGVLEPEGFKAVQVRPQEYLVSVTVREV